MAGENYQKIIAGNITELRRSRGLTQAGLAEKLGYSDKSVSKWERAEGIPDVLCLKSMADLFGVTVDYMLTADHPAPAPDDGQLNEPPKKPAPDYAVSHLNVALLSVAGTWLLAGIVCLAVSLGSRPFWLPLVIALPVTALLLVIFNALWGRRERTFPFVSALVWSILFLVCWILRGHNVWLLMTLGIPATVVVWLACRVRVRKEIGEHDANSL